MNAFERQKKIYLEGASGIVSSIPVDAQGLENKAIKALSPQAAAYIVGGAGQGDTMRQNRRAFERWRIIPRMLRDVSARDTSIELFGKKHPYPLFLAPIGVLEMAHPEADLAVAKAAAAMHIPYIFSNQASVPMEVCAAAMGDQTRWFQLYWSKSDELVASFVSRAESAGCEAIVVTLDTTLLGWRTQDLELAYLPFLRGMGIAQYTSDPVFRRLLEEPDPTPAPKPKITYDAIRTLWNVIRHYPGSFLENAKSGNPRKAVKKFIDIYTRPSLTWENLAYLREITKLPILLKGILHPDDALKALDHGINGLVISNHGGRQVDGAVGTMDMLPRIAEVVQGRIPLLLDSGVRGGADIFKALALGATAVCLGRPYVYGLALGGSEGVQQVLANYLADFDLTMALAGCRSIDEIGPESVMET
ncbi:lactate 2-monooxygenase [Runella salmonicolor]|uniref:Lactate 2-monooxygenase n=1 Tax=Runella salmonicolor TaxID=2950278 RepID=A0ABT1FTL0_9BACT|nr:lactate 2-monooxygenase [Runella salmonicolor]MCP1385107.1 lactate 2-monooxygenase [Runella salmonicolor]